MNNKDVGILLNENNIKLRRLYFKQACSLIGIRVIYRAPMENKVWDGSGELDGSFYPPEIVNCLFTEHVNQKTMKKLGWVAELQENSSIIEVPYDLKNLQIGALFIIPSGIDNAKGRVFKVISMENIGVKNIISAFVLLICLNICFNELTYVSIPSFPSIESLSP